MHKQSLIKEQLFQWLESIGLQLTPTMATGVILTVILLTALAVHVFLHLGVLRALRHLARQSQLKWQDVLFRTGLFRRGALTLQGVILHTQARIWLDSDSSALPVLEVATELWILLFALLTLFSLLDTLHELARYNEKIRTLPLRGIFQGIKLVAAVIALILAIALLIGKSPLLLFSGLGAMTAVLLLVFKDPILGFVAGIQLSANNMLAVGDWLEMPKYGADGDVIDINLTTVKVRNWDKTITTIPTYALISDSFKNWRGMVETGGRRIKRPVYIDATSVRFLSEQDIQRLRRLQLLSTHIETKLKEIEEDNRANNVDPSSPANGRRLTNLGVFRAYLTAYLKANKKIHKDLIQMVRQLEPGANGIPLEVYAFTNDTQWVAYEGIQADIFDHIFAVLPEFDLRVYQNPTGHDVRQLTAGFAAAIAESRAGN
ncbi:MAG TPA: mechanosensitive ion channel domain-containing protein [Methylophilaceae bacterium]|jgi:miniconductance mechanosensitive channel